MPYVVAIFAIVAITTTAVFVASIFGADFSALPQEILNFPFFS